MIGIAIAQIIVFFAYLVVVQRRYGWIGSISESWYKFLADKESRWFNIFTALIGIGMCCYTQMKDVTQMFFALSGFCLFTVSIASDYKTKSIDRIHYFCALGAIGLGFAGIIYEYGEWWPLIAYGVSIGVLKYIFKISNFTYWIEVLAFSLIFSQMIIRLL